MNICFICAEYPKKENDSTGGFGRYVSTLSEGLVNYGHIITVVCKSDSDVLPFRRDGVNIVPLKLFGLNRKSGTKKIFPISIISRLVYFLDYPIFWSFSVYRYLLKNDSKFDVIESGDFAGELFFYSIFCNRKPTVIKLHTPSFVIREFNNEQNNLFFRIMAYMEVMALKKSKAVYSPTMALAKIVSLKIGRPIKTIIPYAIESSRGSSSVKRNPHLILYVGKMQKKKGVFVLLHAISQIIKHNSKLKFIFVGPDTLHMGKSTAALMESYIIENNLQNNVVLEKNKEKKELYKLYSEAVITVVPSQWENFPNVILEAMDHGSIVIASRAGGINEMIEDKKTGYLFTPGDHLDLAQKLVQVLKQDNNRKIISLNARNFIRTRYKIDTIVKKTITYYSSLFQI